MQPVPVVFHPSSGLATVGPGLGDVPGTGLFGAKTPGTKTSGVQEALDAVATAGGGLVQILPGAYPVSAPVVFRSLVAVLGLGATLVNAANLTGPFESTPDAVLSGARIIGLTLDGSDVSKQTVLSLTSPQHCHVDLRVLRAGAGSTGVRLTTAAAASPVDEVATTAASRSVYTLDVDDCETGLLLEGLERAVTNNSFPAIFVTRCTGVGVDVRAHADNNSFGRVHVQLVADKAIGFQIGTPGEGTGSHHNILVKLTVDCYRPRGAFGVVINQSHGTHILNVVTSGQGFEKVVKADPRATNFTVFDGTDMVRYEGAPSVPYS